MTAGRANRWPLTRQRKSASRGKPERRFDWNDPCCVARKRKEHPYVANRPTKEARAEALVSLSKARNAATDFGPSRLFIAQTHDSVKRFNVL